MVAPVFLVQERVTSVITKEHISMTEIMTEGGDKTITKYNCLSEMENDGWQL